MKVIKNSTITALLVVAVLFTTANIFVISSDKLNSLTIDSSRIAELDRSSFSNASIVTSYTELSNLDDPIEFIDPLEIHIEKASEVTSQTWWQALLYDALFRTVIPIFLSVLAALAYWVVRKVGLKLDLEILDKIAGQAADFAEHRGASWLKATGEKSGGALKERWAWELVESVDAKLGASEALREKLRNLILSKIPDAEAKASMKETNGVVVSTEGK